MICERCDGDFLDVDDDNFCEQCRNEIYEEEHGCHSCGDMYEGKLVYVGNNAVGVPQLYCPICTASDIANELGMMEEAHDANDKLAHRLCAIEETERLLKELKRGLNDSV